MDETAAVRIADLCSRILHQNWREGEQEGRSYGFTAPSPGHYDWQWYWDSCFHAIVWRRIDPGRARFELETLLDSSRDGFIGHTSFLGRPLDLERAIRYNVATRRAPTTSTIQPPLLAWAWSIAVGDPARESRIHQHHEWLRANRDLEGDNLLWLIQPDESGMDASPKFDHVWGRRAHGRWPFPLVIHANRRRGFDARRIAADGRPVVCEVVTNVLWSLSEQALGNPSPTPALVARLWDEDEGRFVDQVHSPARAIATADVPYTWDTLAPLALPDLPEEIGHRLVQQVLLRPGRFWGAVPLPSVALDDPSHTSQEDFWGLRRLWRGPSWVNSAWFVWLGLHRLGYVEAADDMRDRLATVVLREGLREYYDARSGAGMGARDFGWSSLVWEMVDPL
ncbi:MAG: hypothetical protein QNJ81_10750 [Acidimicrobiia bacterium]|nr:hypothetical protein [Acidimicrobiia bacterium]